MDESVGMMMDIPVFGVDLYIWLLLSSGIFYFISAMLIWKPFKQEGNELIHALFAFLIYQSISMIFMGVEMWTMNIFYSNIAALSIFIGSAYMLKFPFSKLSKNTRNIAFMTTILILLGIFVWFMLTEEKQHMLMNFVLWYDLAINGIVVGGSIILFSMMSIDKIKKRKTIAGGAGVISCCVVANATMITGALTVSAIFQFLAPLLIIASIKFPKKDPVQDNHNTANI